VITDCASTMRRNSGIVAHGQESSWTWAGEVLLRNVPTQVRHVVVEVVGPLTLAIEQTRKDMSRRLPPGSSSATVLSLAGSVNALSLADGSSVLASAGQLQFDELRIGEHCDVFGISADRLRHQEIESLGPARRVGLHAGTRRTFKREATKAAYEGQLSIQRLADKRRRLLTLAIETHQSGHVQSVLREAERDARRRSLPKLSRERFALELWRSVTGYGERIAWPLVTASLAIVPLGIGHVGWAHFSSRVWWGRWSHLTSRLESLINFALPGIDAIGLDGTTGIWGIAAKLCSVICLGAALNAARKLAVSG
jgi:hypothetical protein